MTFSLVARVVDPESGKPLLGVVVASKFLGVGAMVPGADMAAGAIATQAMANLRYIPDGLALLAAGRDAATAIEELTGADADCAHRQLGIVDRNGSAATFTGGECMPWAGGRTGEGWTAQGNILTGPEVIDVVAEAWEQLRPDRTGKACTPAAVASALVAALLAGDRAGGDSRGRQSAAILVLAPEAGYGGGSDVAVDLRVDDHADPVVELQRLLGIHDMLFGTTPEDAWLPVEGALEAELRTSLSALGYPDPDLDRALSAYAGVENLEERLRAGHIDPVVLNHLRNASRGPSGMN